jgi:hypothetical protein
METGHKRQGEGYKRTGTLTDRDANGQGQGHRWRGTQTDRDTNGQGHKRTGQGNKWTRTLTWTGIRTRTTLTDNLQNNKNIEIVKFGKCTKSNLKGLSHQIF